MSEDFIPFFKIDEEKEVPQTSKPKLQPAKKFRKVRSDKHRDIKFPVSKEEQIRLKIACKLANSQLHNDNQEMKQTRFNTLLLEYSLKNNLDTLNLDRLYKDSNLYMHTKPSGREYEIIGGPHGLSTRNGISDRRLVYCLVITALETFERKGDYRDDFFL